ncbi:phytanoyl-CoA dioxygenase domain-containing protein 1 homolog isoform X1 [Tribolium castaneum]|uniref:Phytanoyl-CoA dioxygenase domain-containing protein 1 homolog-like Protein n=2 Tax=Tribolium castaneum TaxID=7070 RepID=D6WGI8_TRICA|nr:PREDICTED: phytanoyl-CoA dioxygenase domain-containing protein 1 homolog [Tribolium castaneum]EFA00565.1 Phytanoyl-CoA dioxygenase domain-containing protein 1 homolog-like Protein [Tribolium castaneum]|eukprot:XP_970578.1 PREDICTED: phytanoyl-CoA dioxygenase domain-containing protein 1 homolog [Tribolium castaneum]
MWNIKQQFEKDGYVVLEDFLSETEINELRAECDNLVENMPEESKRAVFSSADSNILQDKDKYFLDSADKISYFYEADALGPNGELKVKPELSLNKIGHALHELNPVFRRITLDERVKECCFQLGFEDPVVVQSMYIFKNPGLGSEVIAHQDASYLHTEPVKVVGFWIALEDATLENGCLWFSKGSHKSGVHRRYIRNPDKNSNDLLIYTSPPPYYQKSGFTAVPVKKGTCVLIHGQVVHFSEPNKSEKSRHAYTFHVVEQKNTKYSEDNWLQLPQDKQFLSLYKN